MDQRLKALLIGSFACLFLSVVMISRHSHLNGKKKLPPESIKIGVSVPFSGTLKNIGGNIKNTLELYVDALNKLGGIQGQPVELVFKDTGFCSQTKWAEAYGQFVLQDKVQFVIGPFCGPTAKAASTVADEHKLVTYVPANLKVDHLPNGEYIFINQIAPSREIDELIKFINISIENQKGAIVFSENDAGRIYQQLFEDRFKVRGGELVSIEAIDLRLTYIDEQIARIKEQQPGFIYLAIDGPAQAAEIIKRIKDAGISTTLLLSRNNLNSEVIVQSGEAIEGAIFAVPLETDKASAEKNLFDKAYKKRYLNDPDIYAHALYDFFSLAIQGVKTCNGSVHQECLRDFIKVEKKEGASGHINYDNQGLLNRPMMLKTIRKGEIDIHTY